MSKGAKLFILKLFGPFLDLIAFFHERDKTVIFRDAP